MFADHGETGANVSHEVMCEKFVCGGIATEMRGVLAEHLLEDVSVDATRARLTPFGVEFATSLAPAVGGGATNVLVLFD